MPAIGHLAVGLATARIGGRPERRPRLVWLCGLVARAYLPDLDVIAFKLGIPYHAPWGHRGAAHSLGFALILGALLAAVGRLSGWFPASVGILGGLVMASHGVMDTLTDGGLGIAVFWPSLERTLFCSLDAYSSRSNRSRHVLLPRPLRDRTRTDSLLSPFHARRVVAKEEMPLSCLDLTKGQVAVDFVNTPVPCHFELALGKDFR